MNIEIMIPVVTPKIADLLLESIEINTIKPRAVHIIDNTSEGLYKPSSGKYEIIRHRSTLGNTGVNKAWNWAKVMLFDLADICCFMNDDIILNKYYFENVLEVFKQKNINAVVPVVKDKVVHTKSGKISVLKKRQGCCFALRKSHLNLLPVIPKQLKTFFGDDFWLYHSRKLGCQWYVDEGNVIYHEVGVGVKSLNVRPDLKKERDIFRGLING